ncbi:PEP-CTERM sorting domain-containing protein [bacterium]|nr:MAG: PEP-CTERM sorting domain-containing protein [bacterium]
MLRSLLTLSAFAATAAALAVPVNITLTGVGSGSLEGTAFTGARYTITGTGYSEDASLDIAGTRSLNLTSFGFSVEGVGDGFFNDTGRFFINVSGVVGFGAYFGEDFIDAMIGNPIVGYDYSTDFSPTYGFIFYEDLDSRNTSAGRLTLDSSGASTLAIDVQAVPEPMSFAALGLGGLALFRKRRRSA